MKLSQLPDEKEMNREHALRAFLTVLNLVEPEHPYFESPYPISADEVDYGYTRSSFARCGPLMGDQQKIRYSTRMDYINQISRERHLTLITHEISHVPLTTGHSREFWREVAVNANTVSESLRGGELADIFQPVDVEKYRDEIARDPNAATVDRRYWSVKECQNTLEKYLDGTFREDCYDNLRWNEKTAKYDRADKAYPKYKTLTDFPGIGKQGVIHIGPEFEYIDEMVNGLNLHETLSKTVPSQYHGQLWAELWTYNALASAPSGDDIYTRRPDPDLFLVDGERVIPSQDELNQAMTMKKSEQDGIGTIQF